MSDVVRTPTTLFVQPTMPQMVARPEPAPIITDPNHTHAPGVYCYFCPCNDCGMFHGRGSVPKRIEPIPVPKPSYSDVAFVNRMREKAMKREEEHEERLRAEREAEAALAEGPKKVKSSKDQAKNKVSRSGAKRRRL